MVEFIPLPPPWKIGNSNSSGIVYINEVTKEETKVHPLAGISEAFTPYPVVEGDYFCEGRGIRDISEIEQPSDNNFIEFWSNWLSNGTQYGLSIRFFLNDEHVEIRFDGIDGEWVYSYIEGPYGPVTRHDLFVGATVRLFGRNITIKSCTSTAGDWIIKTGAEMRQRIEWLQSKIENVGANPIIRRNAPSVIRDVVREVKLGRDDLRRLQRQIDRLGEQLVDLGLSHLLEPSTVPGRRGNGPQPVFIQHTGGDEEQFS